MRLVDGTGTLCQRGPQRGAGIVIYRGNPEHQLLMTTHPKQGFALRRILTLGLLALAALRMAASAPECTIVAIDYAKIMGGYTALVDFNKRVEGEVAKAREAISVKVTARDAIVKQVNELSANRPKEQPEAEFRSQLHPLVTAVEATEREIRDIQAAPALNKEVMEATGVFRAKIREAVEAELAERGADLAVDLSSVNGAGLPLAVSAKGSRLTDISDGVLARLNAKPDAPQPVTETAPTK